MRDLDPLAYTASLEDDSIIDSTISAENISSYDNSGMVSVTPPLLGEGEEATPLSVLAEVHEDDTQDGKEENVKEENRNENGEIKEDEENVVTSTDDHVTSTDDHVTSTDDHVTSTDDHVTSTDDHVTFTNDHVTSLDDSEAAKNHSIPKYSRTTSIHMSSRPIYDLFAITVSTNNYTIIYLSTILSVSQWRIRWRSLYIIC